ncbi:MAG: hypothetical protein WBX15_10015 [Thermoanaerobaculia bacterium]
MPRAIRLLSVILILSGCTTAVSTPRNQEEVRPADAVKLAPPSGMNGGMIVATTVSHDGASLYYAIREPDGCVLERMSLARRSDHRPTPLSFCPDRLSSLSDGSLVADGPDGAAWLEPDGTIRRRNVVAALNASDFIESTDHGLVWHREGTTIELPRLRQPAILPKRPFVVGIEATRDGEQLTRVDREGTRQAITTEPLASIDSWAADPDGIEIVVSALRRAGGNAATQHDVGLVTVDGSDIRWIGPDPADETTVTWAPRGHKISYVVRLPDGAIIRTVHVPTGFEVVADLPYASIQGIAWEPKAEKFYVTWSSIEASSKIESMTYAGRDRSVVVASEFSNQEPLDRIVAPGTTAVLIPPRVIRYGVKYPLILWMVDDDPLAWSSARAAVVRDTDAGVLVVPGEHGALTKAFWSEVADLGWVDHSNIVVVAHDPAAVALSGAPTGWNFTYLLPVRRGSVSGSAVQIRSSGPVSSVIRIPRQFDPDEYASRVLREKFGREQR